MGELITCGESNLKCDSVNMGSNIHFASTHCIRCPFYVPLGPMCVRFIIRVRQIAINFSHFTI